MINKNFIYLFLITVFIYCNLLVYSQTAFDSELDKKYAPNANSVFNNLIKKNTEVNGSAEVDIKSCIKFYPTLLLRERIFFSYDINFGKGFCLSLGIGKAFGEDHFQKAYFDLSDNSYSASTLAIGPLISSSRYSGSLPLLSVSGKIYFSGEAFDGGYFDFIYRYERVNYTLNATVDVYRVVGDKALGVNMNAGFFGFGYTFTSGAKNNFTHDLYVNAGIKFFNYDSYQAVQLNSIYGTEQVYEKTGTKSTVRILPAINLGYAFGFGF